MENNNGRKALGRGLEQLFSNERIDFDTFEKEIVNNVAEGDIVEIPLDEIRSNPYQPRKTFDKDALNELSISIKEHGVVQPIIVKKSIKGYELVAGERRTKAARIAGLKTIPSIIREFDDREMMEIALIENIQREDLNPIEEAQAFKQIMDTTGMTQESVAEKFGKSRSHITNMLGILRLPERVQGLVVDGKISMGHARSLSKLADNSKIESLANKIVKEELSVRALEELLHDNTVVKKMPMKRTFTPNMKYTIYENTMRDKIGTKVKINNNKIEIPFDSEKDLERILEIINIEIEGD